MLCRLATLAIALMAAPALTTEAWAAETVGGDRAFSFVALGDMPYKLPGDISKFDRLIAAVNSLKPAFTIHVGDIKAGGTPCTDAELQRALDQIQTFEGPLIYTPGDNEWTDCHRPEAGAFDPRERLAKLRTMFFPEPGRSLGKAPMTVESQAQIMTTYASHVENARFSKNDVHFISVHAVGSNNGFEAQDPAAATEFFARDAANVVWIDDGFRQAQETNAKAIVIFMQAEFDQARFPNGAMPRQSGFARILDAIDRGARAFGKPVLVINGDEHFIELKPMRNSRGKPIPNVMKLMVYGEDDIHAVRIIVDPDSPGVFGYVPLIVPENLGR
ncbi:hypothetical protein [Bradyrhizobium sp. LHD-71]|uniref:hypothetical protein n=1 Tax=Bradyrhizobium sp. LHD-71 TaxID=3072141 RepID=UPI00280D5357|nr:hypothetical protein [Bradyrhizobium sp. LHD-71]MDQ8732212.1 hypothetical protein [Bradyrhizobium sp. LHD-71]